MPFQPNAQSHKFLEVWGDDTAVKFFPMYFPEHGPFEFKCQALIARFYVRKNQKRFMHFKDEIGEDATFDKKSNTALFSITSLSSAFLGSTNPAPRYLGALYAI